MLFNALTVSASTFVSAAFVVLVFEDCAVAIALPVNKQALNNMNRPDKIELRPNLEARFL